MEVLTSKTAMAYMTALPRTPLRMEVPFLRRSSILADSPPIRPPMDVTGSLSGRVAESLMTASTSFILASMSSMDTPVKSHSRCFITSDIVIPRTAHCSRSSAPLLKSMSIPHYT